MNKQLILAEIKWTAEANGGRALGHREFCNVTGIKEADRSARFWARWGEAVREAGYQPNSMSVACTEDAASRSTGFGFQYGLLMARSAA